MGTFMWCISFVALRIFFKMRPKFRRKTAKKRPKLDFGGHFSKICSVTFPQIHALDSFMDTFYVGYEFRRP